MLLLEPGRPLSAGFLSLRVRASTCAVLRAGAWLVAVSPAIAVAFSAAVVAFSAAVAVTRRSFALAGRALLVARAAGVAACRRWDARVSYEDVIARGLISRTFSGYCSRAMSVLASASIICRTMYSMSGAIFWRSRLRSFRLS